MPLRAAPTSNRPLATRAALSTLALALGILAGPLVATGCQSAGNRARAEFSTRLKEAKPLTREEIARLYDEIGRAIAGKHLKARQGAVTRELDDREKAAVLGMLSDPTLVGDRGPRTMNGHALRGLDAGATPPTSEIEASQTLWIDADAFIPTRYEFAFAMSGLGDYAFDIIVE